MLRGAILRQDVWVGSIMRFGSFLSLVRGVESNRKDREYTVRYLCHCSNERLCSFCRLPSQQSEQLQAEMLTT